MADTVSETDVKNAAVALVGDELISSPTENSKVRRYANLLYKFARNECYDMPIDWDFATARAEIAAHADEPIHGEYVYQFVLPSKCRRVQRLQESTDDKTEYEFKREVLVITSGSNEVEHDVILAKVSTAYIAYTRLRVSPNSWPAYFTHLVYVRLAILICEPMKQDKTKKNQLLKMYENALREARAGNGAESISVNAEDRRSDEGNTDVLNAAEDSEVDKSYIVNRET